MSTLFPTYVGILFFIVPVVVLANYRHYHIENTDVCSDTNDGNGVLNIGTGAVILQLDNPLKIQHDYHNKIRRCEIHLKAPPHFGIMVYIEKMHLRKNSKDGKCVDLVQFGQDDSIPFVTVEKSKRICGESGAMNGERYDDPFGSLLIWIELSGRRKTSYWPEISSVNLTLVVTAYQANCAKGAPVTQGFMNCGDKKKCIYQKYKCDKHYNCATDNGTTPADEMDCVYEKELNGIHSNSSNNNDLGGDSLGPPLNWISWSLIIVSSGLLALLFVLLCLRLNRNRKCCSCCPLSPSASCEFPDQAVIHSLADLSAQRHLRPAEQNIYLPLTTFLEQPIRERDQLQQQQLTQEGYFIGAEVLLETGPPIDYPEEPPPAYSELYPQMSTNLPGFPQSSITHTEDSLIQSTPNQSEDIFPSTSMNRSSDSEILLAQNSTDQLNYESANRDQDSSLETSEMLSSHQNQQGNVANNAAMSDSKI